MKDQRTDMIVNAIGALPDFLIDESAEGSEAMKSRNIAKWATVAAVFVFVALSCVIFALHGKPPVVTPSNTDNAVSDSGKPTDSTSAPESESAPETTEVKHPEEPEIASDVFKLDSENIRFPVMPTSDRVKSMLANSGVPDAQDDVLHCAVFAVHTVGDLGYLKEELLIPGTNAGYGAFDSRSARFDKEFFSESTLYVSFVEAPAFTDATAKLEVKDLGDALEISFGFTNVGDPAYSTEPYFIFVAMPNSRADNLTAVDCIYDGGENVHLATVRGVITEVSESAATLRLIDESGDIFSDAGTLTLGFTDSRLSNGSAVEIVYDDRIVGNSSEHIEKAISFRMLEMSEIKLPEAVGTEKGTDCFVDTEEGYDLMRNSELNINRNSPTFERSVFGIGSVSEFASFRKLLADAAAIDPKYSFDDEYVAEYDETFFKSHSLLIIYFTTSDSAFRLIPCKIEYGEDGVFTVGICRVNPSVGLNDEAAACIFVPVEKDDFENCNGVKVESVTVERDADR